MGVCNKVGGDQVAHEVCCICFYRLERDFQVGEGAGSEALRRRSIDLL